MHLFANPLIFDTAIPFSYPFLLLEAFFPLRLTGNSSLEQLLLLLFGSMLLLLSGSLLLLLLLPRMTMLMRCWAKG